MQRSANTSRSGAYVSDKVVKLLRSQGWVANRGPENRWDTRTGTRGQARGFDVWAMKHGERPMLIQVKSTTTRGPWNDFGPAHRLKLSQAATQAGADAFLYHWPLRGALAVYPESEWPT
jgi:hypothetical protein